MNISHFCSMNTTTNESDCSTISFENAGVGSACFQDYSQQKKQLQHFYKFAPNLEGFAEAIQERSKKIVDRKTLHAALVQQYYGFEMSAALKENIDALLNENTFTVTTGHQLNILGGPLYFYYKIMSAIQLSQQLKHRFPDKQFVPVYWMNTDDHDFPEINHFQFLGKTFSWQTQQATTGPTGLLSTEDFHTVFEEIEQTFSNLTMYEEVLSVYKKAYLEHKTLSEATRYFVNYFFGKYGLVCLDQNDAALKRLFKPTAMKDLQEENSFLFTEKTISEMEAAGYEKQVNPRNINFFYTENAQRNRIVKEGNYYKVLNMNIRWNGAEIEKEWEENPTKFSTNVVTRPLYQETVLPNLAYIGGPAEIHYWLQYKATFDYYAVFYPVLVMRDSFVLLTAKINDKLQKTGMKIEDFFAPEEQIIKQYILEKAGGEILLTEEENALRSLYAAIATIGEKIDKTLVDSVQAEMQKALNGLKNIEGKFIRAKKNKEEQNTKVIRDIKQAIFPGGSLQERKESMLTYTSNPTEWIDFVLKNSNPLQMNVKTLVL